MNKQQLANKIWESANKMRAKIEANEYKDYILGFIFYKFLSDNQVAFLHRNGMTDEEMQESLVESDEDTLRFVQENVGYFIAYQPVFINKGMPVYNSTVNETLTRRCKEAGIPVISVHGLRHTHASLLLFAGVSIASVARRLGHSSMTTTQKTYLHIIHELENKDVDLMMRSLSGLS